jgi:hypothetical protein
MSAVKLCELVTIGRSTVFVRACPTDENAFVGVCITLSVIVTDSTAAELIEIVVVRAASSTDVVCSVVLLSIEPTEESADTSDDTDSDNVAPIIDSVGVTVPESAYCALLVEFVVSVID